jgi:hypothetical protein
MIPKNNELTDSILSIIPNANPSILVWTINANTNVKALVIAFLLSLFNDFSGEESETTEDEVVGVIGLWEESSPSVSEVEHAFFPSSIFSSMCLK